MKDIRLNKTSPTIKNEIQYNVSDMFGSDMVRYTALAFYSKFKDGRYIGSGHMQIVSQSNVPKTKLVEQFVNMANDKAKKGRYHDWFFAPKDLEKRQSKWEIE